MTLYGACHRGGGAGIGTVFAVHTDGTGFTVLHTFSTANAASAGAFPNAVVLVGNTLYGTTLEGGNSGNGTVYGLSFPPQLTTTPAAPNLILSWPTNYAGFDYSGYILQSTTNLGSAAVWITNSPAPIVVNGQNTVTNPISGTQQFFRLNQ